MASTALQGHEVFGGFGSPKNAVPAGGGAATRAVNNSLHRSMCNGCLLNVLINHQMLLVLDFGFRFRSPAPHLAAEVKPGFGPVSDRAEQAPVNVPLPNSILVPVRCMCVPGSLTRSHHKLLDKGGIHLLMPTVVVSCTLELQHTSSHTSKHPFTNECNQKWLRGKVWVLGQARLPNSCTACALR